MLKRLIFFSSFIFPVLLFGCATDIVQRYCPSPDLAIDLKDNYLKYGKHVKIESVTGCYELDPRCRLYGKITPTQNIDKPAFHTHNAPITEGFCAYIKNAFNVELKKAELFSSNADIEINLEFKEIKFSSVPIFRDSYWKYTVEISSKNIEPFSISSTYKFSTSFFAFDACEQVASSFSGSVEQLLKDITNNSQFSAIFSKMEE